MDDAVQTVMTQCELWTDNNNMNDESSYDRYRFRPEEEVSLMAAEEVQFYKR